MGYLLLPLSLQAIRLNCALADGRGRVVDKKHMVAAWGALGGDEEVADHSARCSGAKMLCRCGWELWKIPVSWEMGLRCDQGPVAQKHLK